MIYLVRDTSCKLRSNISFFFSFIQQQVVEQGKDPKTFRSPTWKNEVDSVMTCYKLVTIEFKWFGLQMKVEDFIFKTVKQLILNFQRQVFCSLDAR